MRLCTITLDDCPVAAVRDPHHGFVPLPALDPTLPADLLELLRHGLDAALTERLAARLAELPESAFHASGDVHIDAPYRRPDKLWGIGLNYVAHADDLATPHPTKPASFLKGAHTIVGPDEPIVLPPEGRRVTAEAELGLVIGRTCWQVDEAEALDSIAAVCPVLDQTAEDILQENPRFLTRSKNFPTFFAFGPELVTLDEALAGRPLEDITVGTWKNGELFRDNVVAHMTYDPAYLVSFHSRTMPLYPGDIIATGTPGAVVVDDGDFAECRIDGIGRLRNPVVRPDPPQYAEAVPAYLLR
ncbi:MAG: fumarylacetoacetate hydrolase [Nitriliruptorales bacterium]|nr:fumarylacetoacetate hydrolase [Nitriliruptorales bacterium]